MNYHNIDKMSVENGTGIRCVLWLSGCEIHCKNCQNPQTWDKCSGIKFDQYAKKELLDSLSKDYIKGLTLSGGNPLEKYNILELLSLLKEIKKTYPDKDIWCYSGYTYDQLMKREDLKDIWQYIDVLVDGPYIDEQRDITLKWRGSKNQRVIDIQRTIKEKNVILYCD